ncbi:MAG: single-stranded DNA-binding protein [Acidobacteria bacterium]|nr:single-stranded DNA-binding protein [Acidobacteriota bacterium]
MARSVNKVILVGHLGKDPDVSYTSSGQALAKFSLATNRRSKDKSGEWKDETDWHNIVAWGKTAEFCGQYLTKGRLVYVEGRIQNRTWEDKEGNKRYATDIVANDVIPLGGRGEEAGGEPVRTAAAKRPAPAADDFGEPGSQEITDDDIPF